MEDNKSQPGRPSALPRPTSRLPMPKSTAIPTAVRPSHSRNSPSGGAEIRNPRLRPAASRERLVPVGTVGLSNLTNIPPPGTASKPSNSTHALPRPRPTSIPPTYNTQPKLPKPDHNGPSRLPPPRDRMATLPEYDSPHDTHASRLPGLRKRASSQRIDSSQSSLPRGRSDSFTRTSNIESTGSLSQASPIDERGTGDETLRRTSLNPRPSLSERTVETLSRLPSSPSLKSRASHSNFFETEPYRPASRPASRVSRPGSSRRFEGSNSSSRLSLSRPGSSTEPSHDFINPFNSQFGSTDDTPVRGRTLGTSKTPSTSELRRSFSSKIASPSSIRVPRSRTPSPGKPSYAGRTPINGSRRLSARPTQPRPSVNGLFKKPAVPALKKPVASSATSRTASAASQRSSTPASAEDWNMSAASPTSTQPTTAGGDSPPQFKKASTALREQIANAKAAKRAAAQRVLAQDQAAQLPLPSVGETPVIPTDNTFDFGLSDDPFNLNRDTNSTSKVIKSRVASARTSGRLNIAALNLKEIPSEVLNMYSLESIGKHDGSWAESVDLTRFVAADNELEMIEESVFPDIDPEELADDEDAQGGIFYGLETLDLHGNNLIALPAGLRRLTLLTSLNLSGNRLANNCLDVISQVTSLRDLKLGGNLLWGTLEPCSSRLQNLEILDLHGNNLQKLPPGFEELHRLRILNLSENSFESLPFKVLSKLPLAELNARRNKLTGVLIDEGVEALPKLQNLDVSSNQLTSLVRPNGTIAMPALTQIHLSMNRLQALPDVSSWSGLIKLSADENSINAFPDGFTDLPNLKSADFSSNDIRVVPAEIARMDRLSTLRLSGNPLRDRKFVSAPIDVLKEALAARLDPVPADSDDYEDANGPIAEVLTSNEANTLYSSFNGARSATPHRVQASEGQDGENLTETDEFATPPTSAQTSPTRTRPSHGSALTWPVKPGGVLDRANTESSSLHPVACSRVASEHTIREIQLHHNLFTGLPESLTFFADSLTILSLAHNQLVGETYIGGGEDLDLPFLKELNLSSNHITGLTALVNHLHAPNLEKLDVSVNRLASLPSSSDKERGGRLLRDAFPNLTVLLIANNHLAELDPESIRGMKTVDAANNDIAHLNPRIGLLGGAGGLERLVVTGNRFRVPRYNVLERGTDATLRWLRGRVPVADMAAWRVEKGLAAEEDASDVD